MAVPIPAYPRLCLPRAFATLCSDATPLVRRAAALHLKEMMEICTPEVVEAKLRHLFLQFVEDDQVRGVGWCAVWVCVRYGSAGAKLTVVSNPSGISDTPLVVSFAFRTRSGSWAWACCPRWRKRCPRRRMRRQLCLPFRTQRRICRGGYATCWPTPSLTCRLLWILSWEKSILLRPL